MKFHGPKFTVPDAIWSEPMPDRERVILIYLMRLSDFAGRCNHGIKGIIEGCSQSNTPRGERHHVAGILKRLQRKGWISAITRTRQGNAIIQLQIPLRHRGRQIEPISDPSKVVQFGG